MNGKELALVIGNTCREAGMDINHPVIRDAMIKAHMEIEKASPKSTDEQRARFVIGAKKGLIDRIKSHFPEHFAGGGQVEMVGNTEQEETPVGAQSQPPSGNGVTALKKGGEVKMLADGTDEPLTTGPETDNSGSDARPNPYPMGPKTKAASDWLDAHPNLKATAETALAAVPFVGEAEVGAEGALAPDIASEFAAGSKLGARGAGGALGEGAETATESAAPGSIAQKVMGNAPKVSEENAGPVVNTTPATESNAATTGEANGTGNINSSTNGSGVPSGATGSVPNSGRSILGTGAKIAEGGAAAYGALEGAKKLLGGEGTGNSEGAPSMLDAAKAESLGRVRSHETLDGASPQDIKIASGNNDAVRSSGATGPTPSPVPESTVTATAPPNAFNNATQQLNNATTPIAGQHEALQTNQNRAQNYAATQTPEAMAAAQKDKGAVYSAGLAASLTPFGGGGANTQSAIDKLANLGQSNLEGQQNYGNNSLTEANKTSNDVGVAQGLATTNALAGSEPGRTAAAGVLAQKQKQEQQTNDYNALAGQIKTAGPLADDSVQAFLHGKPLTSIANYATMDDNKKAAITAIYSYLQQHPELASGNGVVDGKSLLNVMQTNIKNTTAAVRAQTGNFNVQAGNANSADIANTTPEVQPTFADGGQVGDDTDVDSPDEDIAPLSDQDVVKKAFGLMPKGSAVTKDETMPVQDEKGNTVGEAHEVEMKSPVETAAVAGPSVAADAVPSNEPTSQPAPTGDVAAQVAAEAEKQGVDPKLALAVTKTESNFNPTALNQNTNGTADHGPMQVNDMNYSEGEDKSDVGLNIQKGVAYLKACSEKAGGDPQLAAYYYNHGLNSRINPQVVRNDGYANKVVANYGNV